MSISSHGQAASTSEARDRVGGRIGHCKRAGGAVVERGAEFVLDGYEVLRGHVARFALADTRMSY